jgi:hypothetical protein
VKDILLYRLQFSDLVRHLLQARCKPIDATRCLLLTGGDIRADANGEPVDASPHRVEIERYGVERLLIGGRGGCRNQASRCVAINLPNQSGCGANACVPKSEHRSDRRGTLFAARSIQEDEWQWSDQLRPAT